MMKRRIIEQTIGTEGGYVNDPSDSGGETKYGITKKRAVEWGYTKPMVLLDKDTAYKIYEDCEWLWINGDNLVKHGALLCRDVFDCAVNCGAITAGKILQKCLNSLSIDKLETDGRIGPLTIDVLRRYLGKRNMTILTECYAAMRIKHYMDLAEKYPKNKKFVHGWVARVCNSHRS